MSTGQAACVAGWGELWWVYQGSGVSSWAFPHLCWREAPQPLWVEW